MLGSVDKSTVHRSKAEQAEEQAFEATSIMQAFTARLIFVSAIPSCQVEYSLPRTGENTRGTLVIRLSVKKLRISTRTVLTMMDL